MNFFGFFLVTEQATSHVVPFANTLEDAFSRKVGSYGNGVKTITVKLQLTDTVVDKRWQRRNKPKYLAGVREIKGHGLTARIEDALEFTVRPEFESVVNASSEAELAKALLPALKEVEPSVVDLKVPDFDSRKFLQDLATFLETAASRGASVH
jgi:hypothetical protein